MVRTGLTDVMGAMDVMGGTDVMGAMGVRVPRVQQARRARITMPPAGPGDNRWGLVCQGYQPELSGAWSACATAFGYEAEPDPLLEESVFWVITRTLRCFY